jgi:hypothetical protein
VNDILEGSSEIDLRAFIAKLWAHRSLLSATALVTTALFAVVAFTMTPVYRATTVFVGAQNDTGILGALGGSLGQLGGLASLAGVNVGGADLQVQEGMAVLRSREFTEGFIQDNGLMQEIFRKRWDPAAKAWTGPKESWPTLAQASKFFCPRSNLCHATGSPA